MLDQGTEATTRVLDLLDSLPIMIFDVDERGMLQFANKRARERIEVPPDLEDTSLTDVLDGSCRAEALTQLRELFGGENDITSTWKLRGRGGLLIQVDTNAVTIYDNGNPFRVRFYLHDGSEPVAPSSSGAEFKAALKEEQEYTKALIQKSGLLVYILDTKDNIVEINKKMEEVTGFSRDNAPNLETLLHGLYPDAKYCGIVERIHQNMYKNQHIRETELTITTAAGEVKHISWSTARLKNAKGQVHGFIATGIDVSEKKRLEQWVKLQSSCFDRVSDAVVVSDLKGQIINWVGGSERMLGFAARDMTGKSISELFIPEYRHEISASLHEGIDRDGKWSGEMTLTAADGRTLAVRFDSTVILNEKGAPIAMVSVIHDLTREKELEAELDEEREEVAVLNQRLEQQQYGTRDSNSRLEELERRSEYFATKNRDLEQEASRIASGRVALEAAIKELQIYQHQVMGTGIAALITAEPNGIIKTWSRGAEELTGLREHEAIGRLHDDVFRLEDADWELIHSETLQKERVILPCSLVRRDGSKQSIHLETTVLTDEGGQPIAFTEMAIVLPAPITEIVVQTNSDALVEARNMAVVNELSIGITRDVGDAFSTLYSNLRRMQDYNADLKKVVEVYRNGVSHRDIEAFVRRIDLRSVLTDFDFLFEESQESLAKIRNLARDLSSFLPGQPPAIDTVAVNELAEAAVALLRTDPQHRTLRAEKNYVDVVHVRVDRRNALLTFITLLAACHQESGDAQPGRSDLKLSTSLEGEFASIEIAYSGPAIPQEVQEHLHDLNYLAAIPGSLPFALGRAFQLAANAEGNVTVRHRDGQVSIRLLLPASLTDATIPEVDTLDHAEQKGSILFVDDEKNQLRSYRRFFERRYQVFQAENVDETLKILSIRQGFDAAVIDLLMPESEGVRFLRHLAELNPELASKLIVLIPPGTSADVRTMVFRLCRIALDKPVTPDSLQSVLESLTGR